MRILYNNAILTIVFCLAGLLATAGAAEIEPPADCQICGMNRTSFSHSRTLIVYEDGTTFGQCSIHCAAAKLNESSEGRVKSLMVADYRTKELIDARNAIWVIGGSKQGVMTSQAKWAFAAQEDAQGFVTANGGVITPFDDVMKLASAEVAGDSSAKVTQGHHHDHGSRLLTNPAFGDDVYHTHSAGMWMVNYKFMHTTYNGLRDGTNNVGLDQVIPMSGTRYGYMMAPTEMTMDMHMVMLMYGVTDRFTLMGMANYQDNRMDMVMNMGGMMGGNKKEPPMKSNGLGDFELRGIYKIHDTFIGSLGVSIPTGDIDQEFSTMGMTFHMPYDMQLGSGTVDLKPALTYNALSDDGNWNWGGQMSYTWHIDKNSNHYALGDTLKITSWLQRALGPVASWLRVAYSDTAKIRGDDPDIQKLLDPVMGAPTPDADPNNYGGERIDGYVGLSFTKGQFSIGVEAGLPLYQRLNGLQLKADWYLNAGIQAMF